VSAPLSEICAGLHSKDGPAKNLYVKSDRPTVSSAVTCGRSERVGLCGRQVAVLQTNSESHATKLPPPARRHCFCVADTNAVHFVLTGRRIDRQKDRHCDYYSDHITYAFFSSTFFIPMKV